MIPATELSAMQSIAASLLDIPCTIARNTATTTTVYGGLSSTPETVFTGNCGMARPTAGQMQQYDSVLGGLVSWIVKLPYASGVKREDLLSVTATGEKLTVQGAMEPHSYPTLDLFMCTEVR